MGNPFADRNGGTHRHGQRAEKKAAKRLGGQARAGSGAIDGFKGDITLRDWLVENKTTVHRSISLKLEWLEKISREAATENRTPAVAIQFVDKTGTSVRGGRWVLLPEDEYKELIDVVS